MQLKDKTPIITGGAAGIGKGLVRNFVKEGANILFVDINEDAGLKLEPSAKFLKTDITSEGMEERILTETGDNWWKEKYADQTKKLDDVAPIAIFLASDASQYMTGQTIMADAGSIMLR